MRRGDSLARIFLTHNGGNIEQCVPTIKTLLDAKADPNIYDNNKVNARLNASLLASSDLSVPKLVLEMIKISGGDLNSTTKCINKKNDCISGVNGFMMTISGSPLIRGIELGLLKGEPRSFEVNEWEHFHYLLENVNVNATDSNGRTALHYAVERGLPEIARCLIKAGAKTDVKDKKRLSPSDMALSTGDTRWIQIFTNK